MKAVILLIATSCFISLFAQVVMASDDRMIKGDDAEIDNYKYVCFVTEKENGNLVSIGSLVDKTHVLTTLISISFSPRLLIVYCGTQNRNEATDDNSFQVVQMSSNYEHSVTVLTLDKKIHANLKEIEMADNCEDNDAKPGLVVSYANNGDLNKLNVQVYPRKNCAKIWSFDPKWQTCAVTLEALSKDDIGAPLVVHNQLYGLTLSTPKADLQLFGKVACFKAWVDDKLKT